MDRREKDRRQAEARVVTERRKRLRRIDTWLMGLEADMFGEKECEPMLTGALTVAQDTIIKDIRGDLYALYVKVPTLQLMDTLQRHVDALYAQLGIVNTRLLDLTVARQTEEGLRKQLADAPSAEVMEALRLTAKGPYLTTTADEYRAAYRVANDWVYRTQKEQADD